MKKLPQLLISLGLVLIAFSLILFIYIFAPVFQVEVNYNLNKPTKTINQITPLDKKFGIVIPKIGANAKIVQEVDPYNSHIYQVALTKGVAQAKGTSFPNEVGNMFLFSHSSASIIDANRYNSVFYLLSKLSPGDKIYIYYQNARYEYKVTTKKIVDPTNVSYLNPNSTKKQLTLMTCWPAGTNYKRLLVIAESI